MSLRRDRAHLVVILAILAVVLARLPFLTRPLSRDEAGFLVVARDWLDPTGPGAHSLYGHYWVDRPPLLLVLFRLGDLLGGTIGLRVLGALAAAFVVLATARAARNVAGPRAYAAAAVAAAVLLASPLNGADIVDGELLAAPFVAGALWAWSATLAAPSTRRTWFAAALSGSAAVAAVLVKQNTIDVFVAVGVLELARGLRASKPRLLAWASFVVGACVAAGALLTFGIAHGTALPDLYDAMLTFRVAARGVAEDSSGTSHRALELGIRAVLGGLVPFVAYAAWRLRAAPRGPVTIGLTAVLLYDVVSVLFGGGYWPHYLVQLVVPVALLAGLAVAASPLGSPGRGWPRPWTAMVGVVATLAVIVSAGFFVDRPHFAGVAVGAAIERAAEPGDTVVTLYGDPSIVEAAGLRSPYPYLWSLPIRVRDPKLALVAKTLAGPDAPTWIVVTKRVAVWGIDATRVEKELRDDYQWMRSACGMKIYLRNDLERPLGAVNCRDPFTAPAS